MTVLLNKSDILQHFDMKQMIKVLRQSLMKLRFHQASSPLRAVHVIKPKPFHALGFMPSHIDGGGYMVQKL